MYSIQLLYHKIRAEAIPNTNDIKKIYTQSITPAHHILFSSGETKQKCSYYTYLITFPT